MTKQYIWALAIAGAFVAGTILASTMYDNTAFAIHQPNHNPPGDDDDMGWKEAVADLQGQIDSLNVDDADSDPTNELGPVLAHYRLFQEIILDAEDAAFNQITVGAKCDLGDEHTGGGFKISNPNLKATESFAGFQNSWEIKVVGDLLVGDQIRVNVVCAYFAPLHGTP